MGERLLCKQEVIGSSPFTSTTGEGLVSPAARPAERRREGTTLRSGEGVRGSTKQASRASVARG